MPTDVFGGPRSDEPRLFDVANSKFVADPAKARTGEDALLFERSDCVHCTSALVSFLYDLMRDHLPAGTVERLVREAVPGTTTYTNGWLANYASDLAQRLDPPRSTTVSEAHVNHPPAAPCSAFGCVRPCKAFYNGKPYCDDHFDLGYQEVKKAAEPPPPSPPHCFGCGTVPISASGPIKIGGRPGVYCMECYTFLEERRKADARARNLGDASVQRMMQVEDGKFLKAIGNPPHGFSVETLVHYTCGYCHKWWSIADGPQEGPVNCPVCAKPSYLVPVYPKTGETKMIVTSERDVVTAFTAMVTSRYKGDWQAMFDAYKGPDGNISEARLHDAVTDAGIKFMSWRISSAILDRLDTNKDGAIEPAEFHAVFAGK